MKSYFHVSKQHFTITNKWIFEFLLPFKILSLPWSVTKIQNIFHSCLTYRVLLCEYTKNNNKKIQYSSIAAYLRQCLYLKNHSLSGLIKWLLWEIARGNYYFSLEWVYCWCNQSQYSSPPHTHTNSNWWDWVFFTFCSPTIDWVPFYFTFVFIFCLGSSIFKQKPFHIYF